MCFAVCKTTSELERAILTTLYFADAKNTNSWHARKGPLQRAFPLDVLIVHSSALTISTDGECLMRGCFPSAKPFTLGALTSSLTASVA
jgi:hypothetical protein